MQFFIYAYQNNGFYYGTSDRIFNDSNLIEVPTLPPDSNHKWDGSQWVQKTEAEINENVTESEPEEKVPSLPSSVTDNTIATFDGLSGDRISDSLTTIDDEGVVTDDVPSLKKRVS